MTERLIGIGPPIFYCRALSLGHSGDISGIGRSGTEIVSAMSNAGNLRFESVVLLCNPRDIFHRQMLVVAVTADKIVFHAILF